MTFVHELTLASAIKKNKCFSQPYLYGCSFDLWSRDVSSRSYVLLLVLLAYVLPLSVIARSYSRLVFLFKSSNKDIVELVNSDIEDLLIQVWIVFCLMSLFEGAIVVTHSASQSLSQ